MGMSGRWTGKGRKFVYTQLMAMSCLSAAASLTFLTKSEGVCVGIARLVLRKCSSSKAIPWQEGQPLLLLQRARPHHPQTASSSYGKCISVMPNPMPERKAKSFCRTKGTGYVKWYCSGKGRLPEALSWEVQGSVLLWLKTGVGGKRWEPQSSPTVCKYTVAGTRQTHKTPGPRPSLDCMFLPHASEPNIATHNQHLFLDPPWFLNTASISLSFVPSSAL